MTEGDHDLRRRAELAVLDWNEEVERAKHFIRFSEWCAKHPIAAMKHAHAAVREASRAGILMVPRSCSRCGATFMAYELRGVRSKLVFHHDAPRRERYLPKNFLVGAWVCRPCHGAVHDQENSAASERGLDGEGGRIYPSAAKTKKRSGA